MEEAVENLNKIMKENNYDLTCADVVAASQLLDPFIVQAQMEFNNKKLGKKNE